MIVPGTYSGPININEFETYASEYLPKNAFDYYASGSNDMHTLKENINAFQRLRLYPRVLRNVSNISLNTSLLGNEVASPICLAPTAMHKMAHPDGELATVRASSKMKSCMILSTLSTTSLEDVAKAGGSDAHLWFQLYIYKDRLITSRLVQRAKESGYKAIVLTVDTPLLGQREADIRNRFKLPSHLRLENFSDVGGLHETGVKSNNDSGLAEYISTLFDQTLCWKDIQWLKSITTLPIIVKGILHPEDAKIAVDMGCQAIIVSNHGARQVDGVPATIEVLKSVVDAVDGKAEVYLDGGIRRGTDVFKALSLGARAVFIGRPVLWGLAHSGKDGVVEVLRILNEELKQTMMFSGVNSMNSFSSEYVKHESYFHRI